MKCARFSGMVASVAAILFFGQVATAARVFWSSDESGRLRYVDAGTPSITDFATGLDRPVGMAADEAQNKIYWAERSTDRIVWANLDGGGVPQILVQAAAGSGLRGVSIDLVARKIYWAAHDLGKIQRANLDGTGIEDVLATATGVVGLAINSTAGHLYWSAGTDVWRSNLDGTGAVAIVPGASEPYYLAINEAEGTLYWTDFLSNRINRANLDGTNVADPPIISGLASNPIGIALDPSTGHVYWTLQTGEIQRSRLDGTNIETIAQDIDSAWDVLLTQRGGEVVPAASSWGLIAMSLTVVCVATILTRRRSPTR